MVVIRSLAVMLVVGVVGLVVRLRLLRVVAAPVVLVKLVGLVVVMHVVVSRVRGRVNQSFQSGQVRTGWVEGGRRRSCRGRPCQSGVVHKTARHIHAELSNHCLDFVS